MIKKLWQSLLYSIAGLRNAYLNDKSFRFEVRATPLFFLFGWIFRPLSSTELLFLALSYIMILSSELLNTALETALERLHPDRHDLIGRSKDTASAAVLLCIVFAVFVAFVIAYSHVMRL